MAVPYPATSGVNYTGSMRQPMAARVVSGGVSAAAPAPAPSAPATAALDLSLFNALFDKLDYNNTGYIEADEILAARKIVEASGMNANVFVLLKEADKTKSGVVTRAQWQEFLAMASRSCAQAGMSQAKINEWGEVINTLSKEKVGKKLADMRSSLTGGWVQTTGENGQVQYYNKSSGKVVAKLEMVEDQDRVLCLWKDMKLAETAEMGPKDVLEHVPIIKKHVPEILSDFSKMDKDGNLLLDKKEVEGWVNPALKDEYTLKELGEIWDTLTSDRGPNADPDVVTMEDVGNKIQYVETNIPELVDEFLSVCSGKSCSFRRSDFMAYFAAADLWLEQRLKGIIGLMDLKKQVSSFYWGVRLNRLRRNGGFDVNNDEAIVLMFKGNPGVGKTTIGRIITKLLYKIEIIPEDKFFEVQRDQMVGAALGQTEEKTQKLIDEAKGGVLFVDEAYRLSSDQFGKEAVNCLMRAMTIKGHVIVVAGYPAEMDEWTTLNPGIKRRITYEFFFPNYTTAELSLILDGMIKKQGFTTKVPPNQTDVLIKKYTTKEQLENLNGGVCEHVLRHAVESLNQREMKPVQDAARESAKPPTPSVDLTYQDLEYGCQHIPKILPKKEEATPAGGGATGGSWFSMMSGGAPKPKAYVGS
mmetsp:Transcript_110179/g.212210  ORF Transcript_110179/g.212210 Transcript_110179/m.212210 type:complete len:642 (-) Transcript_110179:3-1928(-)